MAKATQAFRELLELAEAAEAAFINPAAQRPQEDLAAALEPVILCEVDEILAAAIIHTFAAARRVTVPATTSDPQKVQRLLDGFQVAQRTPEWYAESMNLLTASELGNLFKSPRTRALMVMSKVQPSGHSSCSAPVDSSFMTAFDWGIRFEPVVKMLYERRHQSVVAETGRIRHQTQTQIAASPDGIVCEGPRAGRLLEIKCPVTRIPDDSIPDDYYAQMQQQMEVCDLDMCDYVEVKFRAPYSSAAPMEFAGPIQNEMSGVIWRLQREDETGAAKSRYLYDEPGLLLAEPYAGQLLVGEVVMERILWEVITWNEKTVHRNREFWTSAQPKIEAFWADVAAARRGEFIVPEARARRKVVEPETPKCLVILAPKSLAAVPTSSH